MTDLVWVISSSALILVVLVLRAVFGKRMGAGLRYALWGLVLIRLLIPGTVFSSPVSVKSAVARTEVAENMEAVKDFSSIVVTEENGAVGYHRGNAAPSEIINVTPEKAETYRKTIEVRDVLNVIWITGMGLMAAYFLYVNLRFYLKIRDRREPVKADAPCRVWSVQGLESSCLFFNTIYVSKDVAEDPERLRCVLAHELAHRAHGDGFINLLKLAALALHWYNPLVWLSAFSARQDSELFADAGAVKKLGEDERESYGRTLIELSRRPSVRASIACTATTMANNKRALKERVTNVAKARRTGLVIAIVVAAVSLAAVGCVFLGSAKAGGKNTPDPTVQPEVTPPLTHMTPDPTEGPTEPAPENCPFTARDQRIIWTYLETTSEFGVTNGKKLFPDYDPKDPDTWDLRDELTGRRSFIKFTDDGQLEDIQLQGSYMPGNGQLLTGSLVLDGCAELKRVVISGYSLESFSARNCPKLETLGVRFTRDEVSYYSTALLDDLGLFSRSHAHAEVGGSVYDITVMGEGIASINYTISGLYLNAEPASGSLFAGWFDLNGEFISADRTYLLEEGESVSLTACFTSPEITLPDEEYFLNDAWVIVERISSMYGLGFTKEMGEVSYGSGDPVTRAFVYFKNEDNHDLAAHINYYVNERGGWERESFFAFWPEDMSDYDLEKLERDREAIKLVDFSGSVTKTVLTENGYTADERGAAQYAADQLVKQFTECPGSNYCHCSDAFTIVSEGDPYPGLGRLVWFLMKPDDYCAFVVEYGDIFEGYYLDTEHPEYWGYCRIWLNVVVEQSGDAFNYSFNAFTG